MSNPEIGRLVAEYASRFPPLITVGQAAEISHRKIQTIYDWSSRGVLDGCKARRGGILLLVRDGFVRFLLDEVGPGAD